MLWRVNRHLSDILDIIWSLKEVNNPMGKKGIKGAPKGQKGSQKAQGAQQEVTRKRTEGKGE